MVPVRHDLLRRLPDGCIKAEPAIFAVSPCRNAGPGNELVLIARYYFHQHLNGRSAEDRRGRLFGSSGETRSYAARRTAILLGKTVRPTTNTHLTPEGSRGRRTL